MIKHVVFVSDMTNKWARGQTAAVGVSLTQRGYKRTRGRWLGWRSRQCDCSRLSAVSIWLTLWISSRWVWTVTEHWCDYDDDAVFDNNSCKLVELSHSCEKMCVHWTVLMLLTAGWWWTPHTPPISHSLLTLTRGLLNTYIFWLFWLFTFQ